MRQVLRKQPRLHSEPQTESVMADDQPFSKPLLAVHQILTPYVLLVAALAIPHRPRLVSAIFLPPLWTCYYHLVQATSRCRPVAFVSGAFAAYHAFLSFDFLVLRDPRREFRRTSPSHKDGWESYPLDSIPRRLSWLLDLVTTMRGVGWNWGVRPVPRETATTLQMFLRQRGARLVLIWVLLDAMVFWMQVVDAGFFLPEGNAFDNNDAGGVRTTVFPGLFAASVKAGEVLVPRGFPEMPGGGVGRVVYTAALHTWRTSLQGAMLYTVIDGAYTVSAVAFSAVGGLTGAVWPGGRRARWLDWRSWPGVFGVWAHGDWGHGLTGWWGRAWHGLFKYTFISPPRYICSVLNLHLASPAAIALRLFSPFVMSALLHFSSGYTTSSGGWGSARVFLLQPFGILIEQVFLYVYRRTAAPRKTLERWTPYVWTFCWLMITMDPFFEETRHGGVWALQPVPVSVWKGLAGVGEGWWAWRRDTRVGWRPWWGWDESMGGWGIRV